ncbi:IclR family transcriptional regulator [Belnapia sp. T6]|uniref:IclR family transcriptional regulator n=1 Tax=Belnapia mucosa TaxID=2804532 RepID=A0ABS1VBL3_9PROT|nr:IclR family transcriptional regulator [Belnapia mucosa]MBL6459062.1 IclR family transcriptional regulator [Belnapia mucosa]
MDDESDTSKASPKDVGAVFNAVQILACLAASTKPMGVAAVARASGVSTSTCFNILRTLTRARYVAFHHAEKTYSLGLAIAELAAGLIGTSPTALIRPEMERLALKHGMLVLLWRITEDDHVILVDRAHSQSAIRVEISIGFRMPALAGAVGRSIAAALDLPAAELSRRFKPLRWQSSPGFDTYRSEVAAARNCGWAIDKSNLYNGIISIGTVICDASGAPRFGLSGVCIAGQYSEETLHSFGQDLLEVASIASKSLYPKTKQ